MNIYILHLLSYVMRKYTLLGVLILLIFPFGISQHTSEYAGTKQTVWGLYGMTYTSYSDSSTSFVDNSEFFRITWLTNDNHLDVYEGYFAKNAQDTLWQVGGILLLFLIICSVVTAIYLPNKNISTILLLLCGILVFLLRLRALTANDYSFYQHANDFGVKTRYIEVPTGLIFSVLFSVLGFYKDGNEHL